jgi:hypothetical protein
MPNLSDDGTTLDTLFTDWSEKVAAAKAAADISDVALEHQAELRQATRDACALALTAAQALYDRVFAGPATTEELVAAASMTTGTAARDALDPQVFADKTYQSIMTYAMNNGFVPAP